MGMQNQKVAMDWPGILLAGIAATIVVTLTMLATGTDILAALGGMLAGPGAESGQIYLMGAMMHLAVGLAYAALFALVFVRVREWGAGTKGIVFGFVITVFALVFMPLMAGMVSGHGATGANPCSPQAAMSNPCMIKNPCHGSNPCAMKNPCHGSNPCGMKNPCHGSNPCGMKNPCHGSNPCGMKNPCHGSNSCGMKNPCHGSNPCGMKNPCHMANPCGGNPCNPGGGGNAYGGLISLLNHIAFGLTLSLVMAFRMKPRTQV